MALAPTFGSAAVATDGNSVVVTFTIGTGTSPLLPSTGVTGFTVSIAGTSYVIPAGTASALVVTLPTPETITAKQAVSVSYTPGNLTDSQGSPVSVLAIAAHAVTNGSTVPVSTSGITSRKIGAIADAVNIAGYANVNPLHTFTLLDDGANITRAGAVVAETYIYDVTGGYRTDAVDSNGDLIFTMFTSVH